jgi:hypothetical protein
LSTSLSPPSALGTVISDLVLVRMALPKKKPDAPKKVRDDVNKLLASPLSATTFDDLREELVSADYLSKGKRNTLTLTETGRERALRFIGVAELPRGTNWSKVISKLLFPKACGLSNAAAAKLDSGDKLAAFLLKRKYELGDGAGATVNQVMETLVCREVGFPEETTLEGLVSAVLSRFLESERLSKKQLAFQLPLFQTGLTDTKAESIRRKLVQQWLSGRCREAASPETQPDERFDLADFAATVKRLASDSGAQDRFHDNKVFISSLWHTSQSEPSFPQLTLAEFKQRLVEANQQNLVHLSRADLVQAMAPHLVAESETSYLNATFHFVLLEDAS